MQLYPKTITPDQIGNVIAANFGNREEIVCYVGSNAATPTNSLVALTEFILRLLSSFLSMIITRKRIFRYLLLAFVLWTGACAFNPIISVETLPAYDAVFERREGWTGADGAYTVALSENAVLWLFGDTWYGEVHQNRHVNATIINNSLAIQRGRSLPRASVEFHAGRQPDGHPLAFVRPDAGRGWFWPYDGIRIGQSLHLFLIRVERTEEAESFGFAIVDTWLGTISNPDDAPQKWRLTQRRIPWGRFSAAGDTLFGSALLIKDPYVYIYGTTEKVSGAIRRKYMILARVPESQLNQFDQWRFFSDGEWSADFRDSTRLCSDMANEYSVSYLPSIGRYVAVYTENGFSENIMARFAPDPHGPWSESRRIFACPEAAQSGDVFCYAAKGQPDLPLAPDELIVSYIANSLDFHKMAGDATLYRPRFLRLKFQRN